MSEKEPRNEPHAGASVLDDYFRALARAEAVTVVREAFGQSPPAGHEGDELRAKLARIRAKEFVTIMEAAFLLGCSDGHLRNLVRKAKKGEARSPVPFRDLDGVVVFKLDELLAWSELPKGRLRPSDKTLPSPRGADTLAHASRWAATPGKEQRS